MKLTAMSDNTFTTIVEPKSDGFEIYSIHDQSGGCANGWIPKENLQEVINLLNKINQQQ